MAAETPATSPSFLDREPAEVAQLDDALLQRVDALLKTAASSASEPTGDIAMASALHAVEAGDLVN